MSTIKKRLLSVCLAVFMIVGLIPANAFAEEDGSAPGTSAEQIGNYFNVDDENGGSLETTPTLSAGQTLKSYENGFVTINKTIEGTDTENEFNINLEVVTASKIEQLNVTEDAAAVLVIDTSGSMKGKFLEDAKKAAQSFINEFSKADATRKIAVVKFSGNPGSLLEEEIDGATTVQTWADASSLSTASGDSLCGAISGLRANGGTNMEAGLVLAENLLRQDAVSDIANKNIILLTDGNPTFGLSDGADTSSAEAICQDGKNMIGSGKQTSHSVHQQVEERVENLPAGITPYAIYVGSGDIKCENRNHNDDCGLNDPVNIWLASTGFTTFSTADSSELEAIFEEISKLIEMQAKAWILKDPMGEYIDFQYFNQEASSENEFVFSDADDTITWNLRLATPEEGGSKEEPTFTYYLSYRIKLDNLADGFETGKYYAANGPTSLSYLLITNADGTETYKLGYAYANIPSVKGLAGSFSFNKAGSFGEALPGAVFELTSNENEKIFGTATSDEQGVVTFSNIPSGHAYTLTETTTPEGYTGAADQTVRVSYGVTTIDGLDENNTVVNESEKTSITVEKKWVDGDDQDGIRPENIKVQLLANNEPYGEAVTLPNPDGEWVHTWNELNVYRGGELIQYSVAEVEVPEGYESSAEDFVITNTHVPATTEKTVTKVWEDAQNQDGIRPTSIQVQLYANETAQGDPVTVTADNNWTYTWIGLPVNEEGSPITYSVEELNVPEAYGSEVDGMTITNTYTPATRDITITKEWVDGNNQDGNRPGSILVQLYAGEEKVGEPVSLTSENGWTYTYTGLAQKQNGADIEYRVEEVDVPEEYTVTVDGFNITNSYAPKVTTVSGSKTWNDDNNRDGVRPESIVINLLANGEIVESRTVTEADHWAWSFTELPVFSNGKEIQYTITENEVKGYTASIHGYNVTNTHDVDTVAIAGTKTWDDNNNQDGKRPESITVNLIANGEKIDSRVVTEADQWAYDFGVLPKYVEGREVVYIISEELVEGYSATVNGYSLTNTHTPEQTNIAVSKVWKDTDDKDEIRPDNITVKLLANGEDTGKVLVLSEEGKWVGSFTGLDVYKDGKAIEYTVEEEAVEGYTVSIAGNAEDGFEITNSHAVAPDTGDHNNMVMYVAIAGVCVVGLLIMVVLRKKAAKN